MVKISQLLRCIPFSTYMYVLVYLLGTLQISVDDLMRVEILHAVCDLQRPGHQPLRRNDIHAVQGQDLMQRPEGAEFHDYAKHWRLGTYASARSAAVPRMHNGTR